MSSAKQHFIGRQTITTNMINWSNIDLSVTGICDSSQEQLVEQQLILKITIPYAHPPCCEYQPGCTEQMLACCTGCKGYLIPLSCGQAFKDDRWFWWPTRLAARYRSSCLVAEWFLLQCALKNKSFSPLLLRGRAALARNPQQVDRGCTAALQAECEI